jgi:protein phosphatase
VQQDIGPISLHSVYAETSVKLTDLPTYMRKTVTDTISAQNLSDAKAIIERLADAGK